MTASKGMATLRSPSSGVLKPFVVSLSNHQALRQAQGERAARSPHASSVATLKTTEKGLQ